jgi:hypothetical protein
MGLREMVAKWILGIYPNCLKFAMAIFDVPESIAVTRKLLCETPGGASITRVQASLRPHPLSVLMAPKYLWSQDVLSIEVFTCSSADRVQLKGRAGITRGRRLSVKSIL